ncbi:Hypothetical_protein [Hexamita inflata]|uniref:Hypothetical_protein n=1 Tax=Hexamita inflata TaxID=28002 RepID=A0AA86UI74_9EUKA|nr:Hypothetical protein HINF_LOCUS46860 [Hexamita inflata]
MLTTKPPSPSVSSKAKDHSPRTTTCLVTSTSPVSHQHQEVNQRSKSPMTCPSTVSSPLPPRISLALVTPRASKSTRSPTDFLTPKSNAWSVKPNSSRTKTKRSVKVRRLVTNSKVSCSAPAASSTVMANKSSQFPKTTRRRLKT